MAAGEQWKQEGGAIVRDIEFADFKTTIAAVNRVADLAEEANHHPDILVHGYNRLRLKLTTHSEGRVTDADHTMAGLIDEIV